VCVCVEQCTSLNQMNEVGSDEHQRHIDNCLPNTVVPAGRLGTERLGRRSRTIPVVARATSGVATRSIKLICSLDTSAFSALEVLTTTALYKFTYLLTYLLIYTGWAKKVITSRLFDVITFLAYPVYDHVASRTIRQLHSITYQKFGMNRQFYKPERQSSKISVRSSRT